MRAWIARIMWQIQCRINRRIFSIPSIESSVKFTLQGASVDILSPTLSITAPLCIGITTYARAEHLLLLVEALSASVKEAGRSADVFVLIVRDTSEHDYSSVLRVLGELFPQRFAFLESELWQGKPGRVQTYQLLFDGVKNLGASYTIMLEDDTQIREGFVRQALEWFDAIQDQEKAVLYLAKFDDDEPNGRWIDYSRTPLNELPIDKTQWFDLHAFIAGPNFFEALNWELFPPYAWRWIGNPNRSSGVSEQFTLRLWKRGNIYQTRESLAYHGRIPSLLNVAARSDRPLYNHPQVENS